MAVGDLARVGVNSYIAYRQESTYGTYAVTTTAMHMYVPTSIGIKTELETMKLDQLSLNRGFTHQVQLDKTVGGSLEGFLHPEESLHFLINAMGGRYTFNSLTSAGDHSITAGNFTASDTVVSLSMYVAKGEQHSWRLVGGVIDSLKISAAIGEPVKMSAEFVFQDSSISAADTLSASLSISTLAPFIYVDGVYRYQSTEALADTTTANEPIQAFELEIKNNLVTDDAARQLGTRILSRRPPATRREVNLKITQRFDTTTAFDRFVQNTAGAVQILLTGESITAEFTRRMIINMPSVRVKNSDPVVEGANEVLQSEIEFDVLVSGNAATTTSRDIGLTLRNARTTAV